jgi:hypothetical protein
VNQPSADDAAHSHRLLDKPEAVIELDEFGIGLQIDMLA